MVQFEACYQNSTKHIKNADYTNFWIGIFLYYLKKIICQIYGSVINLNAAVRRVKYVTYMRIWQRRRQMRRQRRYWNEQNKY